MVNNNKEVMEALTPKEFKDEDVFYGMYNSDVSYIIDKEKEVAEKILKILKIKDLVEKQYSALAIYEDITIYLTRDMGRCDIMHRWYDDAVSSYAMNLMQYHPIKMTSTERFGIAKSKYSLVGKKIDILNSAISFWKEQISILKNLLYSIRNTVELMKEGVL